MEVVLLQSIVVVLWVAPGSVWTFAFVLWREAKRVDAMRRERHERQ